MRYVLPRRVSATLILRRLVARATDPRAGRPETRVAQPLRRKESSTHLYTPSTSARTARRAVARTSFLASKPTRYPRASLLPPCCDPSAPYLDLPDPTPPAQSSDSNFLSRHASPRPATCANPSLCSERSKLDHFIPNRFALSDGQSPNALFLTQPLLPRPLTSLTHQYLRAATTRTFPSHTRVLPRRCKATPRASSSDRKDRSSLSSRFPCRSCHSFLPSLPFLDTRTATHRITNHACSHFHISPLFRSHHQPNAHSN